MGPVRQNPILRTVRTAHLSVLMTVHNFSTQYSTELQYTIQHRTVLIISPLTSNHHSSDVVYRRIISHDSQSIQKCKHKWTDSRQVKSWWTLRQLTRKQVSKRLSLLASYDSDNLPSYIQTIIIAQMLSIGGGGSVALSVECRTYDQEVVGSSLGRARGVKTLGKFLTPMCLCSPSSTSWYRPKGGDALRLASKGRYGSCVGGR